MRTITAGRLIAVAVLLLTLLIALRDPHIEPVQAAAPMGGLDRLLAAPRGDPNTAIRFAEEAGSGRIADVRSFVREAYRLAPLVGLDPAIIVAQSAHETGYWTSSFWVNGLNPAGIGVSPFATPGRWASGADAARAQMYLLYIYAAGPPVPGHPLYQYRGVAPSWEEAEFLGYVGVADRIFDLTGRWATDGLYHAKIAVRGNEIFGSSLFTTGPSPQMLIVASRASAGNAPTRAYDGSFNSSWAVLRDEPATVSHIQFDFGRSVNLTSLRWIFRISGYADQYRIRVSNDGRAWSTIAFRYSPPALKWHGLPVALNARYVRFYIDNPYREHTLGYLAEVRFIAGSSSITGAPLTTPTPTPTPAIELPHPAFAESEGQVVVEAEDAHAVIARDGHSWIARAAVSGFAGEGYLAVEPDNGRAYTSNYTTTSPEVRIAVDFETTGAYYLWARVHADGGSDDSFHAGLDGVARTTADKVRAVSYGAWSWTNTTMDRTPATLSVSTTGRHIINLWAREDGLLLDRILLTRDGGFAPADVGPEASLPGGAVAPTATAAPTSTPLPPDPAPTVVTAPPFVEEDGEIAFEAEEFHLHAPRAGHAWMPEASLPDASGAAYIAVLPDVGWHRTSDYASASPELQYQIEFSQAGAYYVWIRANSSGGASDSFHIGLDSEAVASGRAVDVVQDGIWRWSNRLTSGGIAIVSVSASGLHTLNVWAREDGLRIDRILLTTDPNLSPAGFGPAASPREDEATATPSPTQTADATASATTTPVTDETPTPIATATKEPSPVPTSTPEPMPTATFVPEPEPTATPTAEIPIDPPAEPTQPTEPSETETDG
ncbi:MAG: discoidin domain-containing protein [Thermomicrobiales bacterium]